MGAALAHVGESVTVVVRPEAYAAYPDQLELESPLGHFHVPVARATEVPACDVLWIAVKALQLNAALRTIKYPGAAPGIVPLLNGIDHLALLRTKYGADKVIPATIAGETERVAPGHIIHRTPWVRLNALYTGEPLLGDTFDRLRKLGFECRFIDDEPTLMWGKLIFLAPFALATTAADKNVGQVLSDAHWRDLGLACVREACAVAVAEGAQVKADVVITGVTKMPGSMRSSMQKDVDQGNAPELDAIAGPILQGAEKHGIAVPATKELVSLVEQRVSRQ